MTKEELLLTPFWTYKDVCDYFGCQKSKAYQIIKCVKAKFNGTVRFNPSAVKRDSVLAYANTSIEREIYILNQLKRKEETNEKTL